MLRVLVGLSIILLVLSPVSAFRVTEFAPDTYLPRDADSYFVLEGTGSLDNVSITDGEGTIWFPRGMYARGRVTVADQALAFREIHGIFPDYEVRETVSAVPDMGRRGPFALANGKDELTLLERGVVVQEVRWPGDVHPREGQVHFLSGSAWDPRVLLIGQSTFALERFTNVTVTAFVSPDSSFRIMEEAILAARSEILVNAYELTHSGIGELLSTARRRGVSVRVLLEGGPVGGISAEERSVCAAMNRSGIPLLIMTTTDSAHARYRYNHAKYLVVDGENVLISTENFGLHGYPPTGYRGNRGWGVLIENPEVAGYFREVFVADTRGGDVVPFTPAQWGIPSPGPYSPFQSRFSPLRVAGATVTPVLSPDTSSEILSLIDRAKDRIEIEQATVRNDSSGRLNPFLAAAINASRRGVFVKILLDGGKYSVEGPEDNDEMAALVNRIANRESLPLTARILEPEAANLVTVHTKGLIVDRTFVLVSSINWNENSPNFNREAGVILENPSLGVYFSSVFDWDWEKAGSGAGDGGPDLAKLALSALVVFILLIFYLRRRR